jgi:hypothetical protein
MSNASATVTLSARISEAAPARPLLVVERLDHTFGSSVMFTLCAGPTPATPNAAAFTLCAGPPPASFAPTTAPVAVEGDAVAGAWI